MHPFLDLPPSLDDAILSLNPTAFFPLTDGSSPLRDVARGWDATVTGSPTFGVPVRSPFERAVTFSGTGQYATASPSVPTPATSMSVLAFLSTTNATASARAMIGRAAALQYSFELRLGNSHTVLFNPLQSSGSSHVVATVAGAINDGNWHMAGGTFDGTTCWCYRDLLSGSSTTLTGTWHKTSTAALQIAAFASGDLFPGTLSRVAYWADRVLTAAEYRWLYSVAFES